MYIESNTYFEVKAATRNIIDKTFRRRPLNEPNISRLYDDVVDPADDAEELLISEILFYHILWKKIGGLPVRVREGVKRRCNEILTSNQTFIRLNAEEYNDFIQIVHELNISAINTFSDRE